MKSVVVSIYPMLKSLQLSLDELDFKDLKLNTEGVSQDYIKCMLKKLKREATPKENINGQIIAKHLEEDGVRNLTFYSETELILKKGKRVKQETGNYIRIDSGWVGYKHKKYRKNKAPIVTFKKGQYTYYFMEYENMGTDFLSLYGRAKFFTSAKKQNQFSGSLIIPEFHHIDNDFQLENNQVVGLEVTGKVGKKRRVYPVTKTYSKSTLLLLAKEKKFSRLPKDHTMIKRPFLFWVYKTGNKEPLLVSYQNK